MSSGHLGQQLCVALLDASAKGAALILVAALAAWLLRRYSAEARHTVWAVALCGVLVLPALSRVSPSLSIHTPSLAQHPPVRSFAASRVSNSEVSSAPARALQVDAPAPTLTAAPRARNAAPAPPSPWALAAGAWALGVAISLLRMVRSSWRVRKLSDGGIPVGGALSELLAEAQDAGAGGSGVRVLFGGPGAASLSPLTWGALRPVVLLPAGADAWPLECARAVLLHELAHVRRYDWLKQLLARGVRAIYWFHPAVWWAESRLRLEAERACDEQVLRAGVKPSDYAAILLEVTRMLKAKAEVPLCVAMIPTGSRREGRLAQRLAAVLSPVPPRRSGMLAGLTCLLVAGIVAPLAALRVSAAERPSTRPVTVSSVPRHTAAVPTRRRTHHARTPVSKHLSTASSREVEQTRAALKEAQAQLQALRAEVAEVRTQAAQAKKESERARAQLARSRDEELRAKVAEQVQQELHQQQIDLRQQELKAEIERLEATHQALELQAQTTQKRYEAGLSNAEEVARTRLEQQRATIAADSARARLQRFRDSEKAPAGERAAADDVLRAEADLEVAKAEVQVREAQVARTKTLFQVGQVSTLDLVQAEAVLRQAQALLNQAVANLKIAKSHVDANKANAK